MFQQVIALAVILFLGYKLYSASRTKVLSRFELILYGSFLAALAFVVFNIKYLDSVLLTFGFSSSGIAFLFYASVPLLAYWLFRLTIRQRQASRELTRLVRALALRDFHDKL